MESKYTHKNFIKYKKYKKTIKRLYKTQQKEQEITKQLNEYIRTIGGGLTHTYQATKYQPRENRLNLKSLCQPSIESTKIKILYMFHN